MTGNEYVMKKIADHNPDIFKKMYGDQEGYLSVMKPQKDLTDDEITTIRGIIDENYQTEGDLRRFNSQNIKRLTEIGSAKGRRHRVGLPVRGQRTRTNARTRKGKIKIPVAKKK